jgi:hypothetical protein
MKTTSNKWLRRLAAGLLPLLFLTALAAQDEAPKVGFLRLVNAVAAGSGNLHLKIDGEEMYAKGYTMGQRTGGIGLLAGSKKVTVTKEGVEDGSTTVQLGAGETITIVAFAEKVPAEDDKPERWEARILRLKQRDVEKGYRLTVLSTCKQPELLFETDIQGRDKPVASSVKRLMTSTVDLGGAGGDITVRLRGSEKILNSFRPDDPGNYVMLLYDGEDGEVRAIYFYDPKFVIAG